MEKSCHCELHSAGTNGFIRGWFVGSQIEIVGGIVRLGPPSACAQDLFAAVDGNRLQPTAERAPFGIEAEANAVDLQPGLLNGLFAIEWRQEHSPHHRAEFAIVGIVNGEERGLVAATKRLDRARWHGGVHVVGIEGQGLDQSQYLLKS